MLFLLHSRVVWYVLIFYTSLGLLEQTCDRFEKQTKELERRLQELKEKVKDPLPVEHEELHKAKEHTKVWTAILYLNWCSLCTTPHPCKISFPSYLLFSDTEFLSFTPSWLLPISKVQLTKKIMSSSSSSVWIFFPASIPFTIWIYKISSFSNKREKTPLSQLSWLLSLWLNLRFCFPIHSAHGVPQARDLVILQSTIHTCRIWE